MLLFCNLRKSSSNVLKLDQQSHFIEQITSGCFSTRHVWWYTYHYDDGMGLFSITVIKCVQMGGVLFRLLWIFRDDWRLNVTGYVLHQQLVYKLLLCDAACLCNFWVSYYGKLWAYERTFGPRGAVHAVVLKPATGEMANMAGYREHL